VTWVRKNGGESTALATGDPCFDLVRYCVNGCCGVSDSMFSNAARANKSWGALESHFRFLKSKGCPWSAATMAAVLQARWGSPGTFAVKWLRDEGCPYDASVCATAARMSLGLLKALHEMGFPLNWSVCVAAARAGRLDTLQWAHSMGCPVGGCAGLVVLPVVAPVRKWLLARGVACRSK
jgi:hypothetical protein